MRQAILVFFSSLLILFSGNEKLFSQGYNHQWLLGNQSNLADPKARFSFCSSSYTFQNEFRKMCFRGADGSISDKQGNGRDWWVVVQKHNTDVIFKFLLTPDGIQSISSQHLNVPYAWYNSTALVFSPDGTKFSYNSYDSISKNSSLFFFDFDRCTG